ncbi:MAG: DUF6288 domain-containing protein [Planctomycetota bacterium]
MRHLFIALLLLPVLTCQVQHADNIPDQYSLGPIGGRCDATKTRVVIRELEDKAPGKAAGLKVGDSITGAPEKFKSKAWRELGEAILAAEATEDPSLKLKVLRGTEALEVTVQLKSKTVEQTRDDALEWLADQQESDGGFKSTQSPEVSQVVLTSMAGLAWLSAGHVPGTNGKYARNTLKAVDFVEDTVGVQKKYKKLSGKNNNQTNWGLGYGGIFLAEAWHRCDEKARKKGAMKKVKKKLGWIRDRIFKQSQDDGGYGAGPGGANILDYIHVEAVSNFCVAALGCIKTTGIDVDAEKLEKHIKYMETCQMPDGGMGYAHDKKWFSEVGRTAGAMNALSACRESERDSYSKMSEYLKPRFKNAWHGHSTPTMHVLSVALTCQREGWFEDYWKLFRGDGTMCRQHDSSFYSRPTPDTLRMKINLDRNLTPAWTTASWAIIYSIQCGGGLELWPGKE